MDILYNRIDKIYFISNSLGSEVCKKLMNARVVKVMFNQ